MIQINHHHNHSFGQDLSTISLNSHLRYSYLSSSVKTHMLYRGTYNIKCVFTDDDKYEYLKWEFKLIVDKSWPKE
jgi:hypothetical protein